MEWTGVTGSMFWSCSALSVLVVDLSWPADCPVAGCVSLLSADGP